MTAKAKLSDIVGAVETHFDEMTSYLDRQTGRVVAFQDEEIRAAEDDEDPSDFPEWQQDQIRLAKEFLAAEGTGRFVSFPDQFEISEWDMMRDFAQDLDDEGHAEALLRAIQGKGAFRYFKDRVHELGLAEKWYAFRNDQYRRIALDWCRDNNVEVDENE